MLYLSNIAIRKISGCEGDLCVDVASLQSPHDLTHRFLPMWDYGQIVKSPSVYIKPQ